MYLPSRRRRCGGESSSLRGNAARLKRGLRFHTLWVFSFISAMATDTIVVMEQEGNGFNDIYAKSDSNSTLDEPVASWELPVNQRLLLGWSFGKWVCNANFASSTSASFLSTFLPLPLLIISCILSLYLVWSLWDSHHEKI